MIQNLTTPLLVVTAIAAAFLIAVWISLIIWTARDIRQRSQDSLVIILSILSVVLLNFIGYVVYLILRPVSTIAQVYQQALEEEALLQSIEPQSRCSACGNEVKENWQYCPFCKTAQLSPCPNCQTPIKISWNCCPVCGADLISGDNTTDEIDSNQQNDSNLSLHPNTNEDLLIEETDIESL